MLEGVSELRSKARGGAHAELELAMIRGQASELAVSFRQACVTSTPSNVNLLALKEVFNGAFFRTRRFIT